MHFFFLITDTFQAAAIGASLFLGPAGEKPVRYNEIICSDLQRVKETCHIALTTGGCASDAMTHVSYSHLLREKNAGIFEGRPKRFMVEARKKAENERVFRPRNGESWEDLQDRVKAFVESVHFSRRDVTQLPWRILVFTSGERAIEHVNNNDDTNHYDCQL